MSESPTRRPILPALPYLGKITALCSILSPAWGNGVVMVNEVMYHPAGDSQELEFVELHNTLSYGMDVSGWKLSGGLAFTIPDGTVIPADGYLVVGKNPALLEAESGIGGVLGPYDGQLSNGGETLRLHNSGGRLMDEVTFSDDAPWPVAPDGSGCSLSKISPVSGCSDPRNWHAGRTGGTPGATNFGIGEDGGFLETELVSKSATWRFRDTGTAPDADWMQPAYDDSTWQTGPSPLGYDDSWISTVVSYGGDSGNKHPTTHFRHSFEIADPSSVSELRFSAMMDDGAILYLNGSEFARVRMNAGTITHLDFSNDAISGSEENVYEALPLPTGLLQPGTNVLAVELHQQSAGSSDLAFSAELIALESLPPPESDADLLDPPRLVFHEVAGASEGAFWIELKNTTGSPLDPDGFVVSAGGDPLREIIIDADPIPAGGLWLLQEGDLGFTVAAGEPVFLFEPGRQSVADARVVATSARGLGDSGWLTPAAPTPGEGNVFELHEDVVINEIMYHHPGTYAGDVHVASDVEWIELHNRGDSSADLGGWTFGGGIAKEFPEGTTIAAGGYLVVSSFSGGLSNRGDHIVLNDAAGNPADEVRYFDGGRWPGRADGGGSSLELRDPWADNSKPEAWMASDESVHSEWESHSFESIATASSVGPDGQWQEFILGLLDAGEVLLDDISVIEDPAGAAIELVPSGDFESGIGSWRIIGNHRHSGIIDDPDGGGNKVLRLVATGATEHLHNHAEITLANGENIENGKTYRVSFRAKWIGGSRLLNTRLYFNRSAETHELSAPITSGTPGAVNSTREPNIGPGFSGFGHAPVVPSAGETVTVAVTADDPQGVASVVLHYSAGEAAWQQVPMTLRGDGSHSAGIPGHPASTVVQFFVRATDGDGAVSNFPASGPESRALYMVDDGQSDDRLHNFRIIMTGSDSDFMHSEIQNMSNEHMPCTVISRDRDVFYNVGVHLKGSLGGRGSDDKTGYRIRFDKSRPFNGVLDTVSVDKSSLNDLSRMPETLTFLAMNRAGSAVTKYNDWIKVIAPKTARTNTAQLQLGHYSNVILDSQFEDGSDGDLYEFEYVYYAVAADAGGYKISSGRGHTEKPMEEYSGTDKEDYRHTFLKKNNREVDDFNELIGFVEVMGSSGTSFNNRIDDIADVDQWLRGFAFAIANGCRDNFSVGSYHNGYFYRRPSDGRFLYIPHDMDQFHATPSLVSGNRYLQKMLGAGAKWERLYYAHMHDILETAWNTNYMRQWTDEFAALNPGYEGRFTGFLNHIGNASNTLRSQLNGQVAPAYPFAVTSGDQSVAGLSATVSGNGWLDIHEVFLEGLDTPLDLSWTATGSGSSRTFSWSAVVPVEPGVNELTLLAYDSRGNLVGTVDTTVTSTATRNPWREQLRVTELMYDPAGGGDFEFIELQNTGGTALDMDGVRFTEGISFDFSAAGFTDLPAGESCVVVANLAAFSARYPTSGINVAGQYGGKLANEGEPLALSGALGDEILRFRYGTGRGWPVAADGAGHSMVPFGSALTADPGDFLPYAGSWRASAVIGGSPGAPDPTPAPSVLINEVVANTRYSDPAHPEHDSNDIIELHNPLDVPVELGNGWFLSDDAEQLDRWELPAGTTIPARGFIAFDEVSGFHNPVTQGFGIAQTGERVFLSHLPATGDARVVDAVRFKAQEEGMSLGRYQDGSAHWYAQSPSAGDANNLPDLRVVISEIMYRPPDNPGNNTLDEFIEIHNPTEGTIELWNDAGPWRIDGGIAFDFPPATSLAAGESLVIVSFDPADDILFDGFASVYGLAGTTIRVLGPFDGSLDNRSERIALERPLYGGLPTDPVSWVVVDESIYHDQAPWPTEADGTGRSLQRKHNRWSGNDPESWYASFTPSPGSAGELYGPQGVPDWWLAAIDPAWSADFAAAALADHDRDGQSTGDEYFAGTDPLLAESVLGLSPIPGGFGFTTIEAGPEYDGLERRYSVQWSDDLLDWDDNPLPEWTDIPGDGASHVVPVPYADHPRGFFRLEVDLR